MEKMHLITNGKCISNALVKSNPITLYETNAFIGKCDHYARFEEKLFIKHGGSEIQLLPEAFYT